LITRLWAINIDIRTVKKGKILKYFINIPFGTTNNLERRNK
jgi:hypothetical protein